MAEETVREILERRSRSPIARLMRPGTSALVRRIMNRARLGGGGPRTLLDFSQLDTFNRATEASFVDPRPPAAGGTGSYAWDFVKNTTVAEHLAPPGTALADFTQTNTSGGGAIAGSQADPAGGTAAQRITDDAASVEFTQSDDFASMTSGDPLRFSIWVKREVGASQWAAFQWYHAAAVRSSVGIDLDTGETGALTAATEVYVAKHTISSVDWFFLTWRYGGLGSTATDARLRVAPAFGTSLPTTSGPATGSCTIYNPHVVGITANGESEAAPWAGNGTARIPTDGAILIEGARTNLLEDSNIDGANWVDAGSTPTLISGLVAPDGSATAVSMEDDWAAGYDIRSNASVVTDATRYTASFYFKRDDDETRYPGLAVNDSTIRRLMVNTKTGAVHELGSAWDSVTVTQVDADWYRCEAVYTTDGTGTTCTVYAALGTVWGTLSPAATGTWITWGWQLELGAFASSPIRTSGAAATRNKEIASFAAGNYSTALTDGKAKWTIWPNEDSATLIARTGTDYVFSGAGNEGLALRSAAGAAYVAYFALSGGIRVTTGSATWSAGQKIEITIDWANKLFTVSGLTTGDVTNKSFTGGSDIVAGSEALTIGGKAAGGNTNQFFGVIGRPVAA